MIKQALVAYSSVTSLLYVGGVWYLFSNGRDLAVGHNVLIVVIMTVLVVVGREWLVRRRYLSELARKDAKIDTLTKTIEKNKAAVRSAKLKVVHVPVNIEGSDVLLGVMHDLESLLNENHTVNSIDFSSNEYAAEYLELAKMSARVK
ncbi:hypothetical protein AOA57_04325 [Pseudomonas sp. 2588-5]|nr:hypothetical protein AOA57_04325 [Pseudomonas sp. 2588-5]